MLLLPLEVIAVDTEIKTTQNELHSQYITATPSTLDPREMRLVSIRRNFHVCGCLNYVQGMCLAEVSLLPMYVLQRTSETL